MVFWSISMIIGVVVLVLSAATRESGVHMAYAHMAIAAAMSISLALIFIRDTEALRSSGAKQGLLAANAARFSGIVWAWAALALCVTYGTEILIWREWLTFLIACTLLGGLSLVLSDLL